MQYAGGHSDKLIIMSLKPQCIHVFCFIFFSLFLSPIEYDDADHFYRPSMRTRGRQASVKEGSAASVDSTLADEYKVPTTRSKAKQQQHSSQVHQETKGQGSGFFRYL